MKNKVFKGKHIVKVTAKELASVLIAANRYPLGLLEKLKSKDRITSDVSTSQVVSHSHEMRPVLLVHGIGHNASAFSRMQAQMKKQGWMHVFTINYDTFHGNILKMVQQLSDQVDKVIAVTGAEQVDIVAHSLGGIISRYYMTLGPKKGQVKNLVTLGTAHKGTYSSPFLKLFVSTKALSTSLYPGSSFLKTLQEAKMPKDSKITSIYSQYDWVVWPQSYCFAEGQPTSAFQNIKLDFVSHVGLLYNFQVLQHILKVLKN